ncbi:uncharacterized protein LOC111411206 [Olea europaea var. sylvestris]|uniref:uncharacterized protein LOC111411206 n=1 Tax=Olea europaea var. sylvestris TaxID=158386 RepID=UPI000C1D8BDE|nr:uncharacterized protein LOC111411206 [Olea europaea var. sylvestris]
MIVLTVEKRKFVLIEPYSNEPIVESTAEQRAAYEKWVQFDEMAHCYITASMSNVLQQKHQNMDTTTQIMEGLQKIFGHRGHQAQRAAIRSIMNIRMKLGMPVRDHMLAFIAQFNVAELLGVEIQSKT